MTLPIWVFALIVTLFSAIGFFLGQLIELREHMKSLKLLGDILKGSEDMLAIAHRELKSNHELMGTTIEISKLVLQSFNRIDAYMSPLMHDWEELEKGDGKPRSTPDGH